MKICNKCKTEKELSNFNKDRYNKDGLCRRCKDCAKEYREDNKEKIRKYDYGDRYKDRYKGYYSRYMKERRKNDPQFKIAAMARVRTRQVLKSQGVYKSDSIKNLLGCTWEEARAHIESQFTEGMSWENWTIDGWHLDHIRPCSSFDLTDPEQQRQCFHYSNLQPLWAFENLSKHDKWDNPD